VGGFGWEASAVMRLLLFMTIPVIIVTGLLLLVYGVLQNRKVE